MSQELREYDMRERVRKELIVNLYATGNITKEVAMETLDITEEAFDKLITEENDNK